MNERQEVHEIYRMDASYDLYQARLLIEANISDPALAEDVVAAVQKAGLRGA